MRSLSETLRARAGLVLGVCLRRCVGELLIKGEDDGLWLGGATLLTVCREHPHCRQWWRCAFLSCKYRPCVGDFFCQELFNQSHWYQ